ncbi:A/G-specific adenine glycosylase [Corynebacterium kutscheri]|uniref:Adenine DNA glycosylase n=1 Tax=Corynebacterium kutscheri TaxID=35755 RepID=A0A0F6QZI7_9CORY|nr:A/G-specific adenine glycosylase [Corynebacterium kutscheri]AKE40750.1 A/G-specific DNA-adenine glycosylase [Corynebacterium kutscheri]VEH04576.1 A/G-specific adenine glycosylase [Corynebacterium kutscheri]VEH11148.1 A/G-specific adenine glycosylase [Corynebacterium kutscheri]VEH80375.1 A/G-specific adenine glycosylase [Corynebacterium kutscheri]
MLPELHCRLRSWYHVHARPLAWRDPATSAWGILLSEIMSQQTPVARVEPKWCEWMDRWPTPADLAHADTADLLIAWDTLGYPRRALRLQECAQMIVDKHGGVVPSDLAELLALPGIGDYTARAVAAFYYGQRVPVVDTNVRRVYKRLIQATYLQGTPRRKELTEVESILPIEGAPEFSAALMELGALVCTPTPACQLCPVSDLCAWQLNGCPQPDELELAQAKQRVQKFTGTDRQVRGKIMAVLRKNRHARRADIDLIWPDQQQLSRCLFSLLADGLCENDGDIFSLPTSSTSRDK